MWNTELSPEACFTRAYSSGALRNTGNPSETCAIGGTNLRPAYQAWSAKIGEASRFDHCIEHFPPKSSHPFGAVCSALLRNRFEVGIPHCWDIDPRAPRRSGKAAEVNSYKIDGSVVSPYSLARNKTQEAHRHARPRRFFSRFEWHAIHTRKRSVGCDNDKRGKVIPQIDPAYLTPDIERCRHGRIPPMALGPVWIDRTCEPEATAQTDLAGRRERLGLQLDAAWQAIPCRE